MDQDPLLTETELGAFLKVPRKTLQRWRWKGTGPPFRKLPSNAVRYLLPEVQAWLEKRRRHSTSGPPAV